VLLNKHQGHERDKRLLDSQLSPHRIKAGPLIERLHRQPGKPRDQVIAHLFYTWIGDASVIRGLSWMQGTLHSRQAMVTLASAHVKTERHGPSYITQSG